MPQITRHFLTTYDPYGAGLTESWEMVLCWWPQVFAYATGCIQCQNRSLSRITGKSLATYPNNINDDIKSLEMLRRSINHYKYQPYLWLEQTLYSKNGGPHMQNTYTLNSHDTYSRCVSPVFLPQHLHKCKFLRFVVLTLTRWSQNPNISIRSN